MKALYLKYDSEAFWKEYWEVFDVDRESFLDLDMYPINTALKYISAEKKIFECGFGAGRVIRHLHGRGIDIEGVEYDRQIYEKLKAVDSTLRITVDDIRRLQIEDDRFDVSLCFGVIGGLQKDMEVAIRELKRVTKPGGHIIISVMLDNIARRLQKYLNYFSSHERQFYAWMDTQEGWRKYFKMFRLEVVEIQPAVSRYNIYYWAKCLRSREKVDMTLARVKDEEFKLNPPGRLFWYLHKKYFRWQLAGGATFVIKNLK